MSSSTVAQEVCRYRKIQLSHLNIKGFISEIQEVCVHLAVGELIKIMGFYEAHQKVHDFLVT